MRFDPVEGHKCLIRDFYVKLEKQELNQTRWECNGVQVDKDMFLFLDTTDPQIFISGIHKGENTWIEISARIYYVGG